MLQESVVETLPGAGAAPAVLAIGLVRSRRSVFSVLLPVTLGLGPLGLAGDVAAGQPPTGPSEGPVAAPPPAALPAPDGGTDPPDGAAPEPPPAPSCKATPSCTERGLCTPSGADCVASSDADCVRSDVCRTQGRCAARGDSCVVGTDADCTRSQNCLDVGDCAARGGMCVPASDPHCTHSAVCAEQGLCSVQDGVCVALIDADCQRSKVCKEEALCSAARGRCGLPQPKPPEPPIVAKPAAPELLHAFEVLPSLGADVTSEGSLAGFFGEASVGMRFYEYAALHAGIGYGGIGPEFGAVMLSFVPQFRPLAPALGVDLIIGMPLGYHNRSTREWVVVDGVAMRNPVRADGFHLGALLGVMPQINDAFAIGPIIRYARLFGPGRTSLLAFCLAGRYALWLE